MQGYNIFDQDKHQNSQVVILWWDHKQSNIQSMLEWSHREEITKYRESPNLYSNLHKKQSAHSKYLSYNIIPIIQ